MRKLLLLLVFILMSSVCAADINDGVNALGRGKYELALVEFRPGAEEGDVSAQNFLAYTYTMLEDYEEAYAWYYLSAECGSIDADIDREVLSHKMTTDQIEKARLLGTDYLERYCVK